MCPHPVANITKLWGIHGEARPVSTAAFGNVDMYTAGACAAGLTTLFAGPRLVFFLSLGENAPLGGTLTITTCGHSANNPVLYVGTGCPTWTMAFNCRAGNDNAGDEGGGAPACAANPRASTVVVPAVTSRAFFVQLGGFSGAPVTSGLAWDYAGATPSRSAAGTPTRSRTTSRSRSRTRSRTKSPQRSLKGREAAAAAASGSKKP
jgi:hypothetical protein